MKKFRKIVLGLVVLILLLLLLVFAGEQYAESRYIGKPVEAGRIGSVLAQSGNINLYSGKVYLSDISFPDSTVGALSGVIQSVEVSGINWFKLLRSKSFAAERIATSGIRLRVNLDKLSSEADSLAMDSARTAPVLTAVIDEVEVQFEPGMELSGGHADIGEVFYDAGSGRYNVALGSGTFDIGKQYAELDSFRLVPRYDKETFAQVAGFRTGRIESLVQRISFIDLDYRALMKQEKFTASKIEAEGGYVSVFTDKRLPIRTEGYVPYPHEALMRVPIPVSIDSVVINADKVEYSTINPHTFRSGSLDFLQVQAVATNVTNISEEIEENNYMEVDMHGSFENDGRLYARFDFPMNDEGFGFDFNGKLTPMELSRTNKFVIPVMNMDIVEGSVDDITFNVRATYEKSMGTLVFKYRDLKIEALNEEREKRRKLITFLANTFVIRKDNQPDQKHYREGVIDMHRQKYRGFFHFVWSSLEDGIVHVLLPHKLAMKADHE